MGGEAQRKGALCHLASEDHRQAGQPEGAHARTHKEVWTDLHSPARSFEDELDLKTVI